MQFENITKNN